MKAYAKSKTPKPDRDKRQTPVFVFERIQDLVNIEIFYDVCAETHTSKCHNNYWDEIDNSLIIDWCQELGRKETPQGLFALWMNPPYSNPGIWCEKAYKESQKGLIIIGCLPDDRSTGWYQDWVEDKAQIIYVPDKRISFEDADGVPQKGNPKGSVIPVWMPFYCDKSTYVRFHL